MESSNFQTSAQNYIHVTPPIENHGESGRQTQNDTVSSYSISTLRNFVKILQQGGDYCNFIGQNMFGFCIGDDEVHECFMDVWILGYKHK